jgi:hypothetical protein
MCRSRVVRARREHVLAASFRRVSVFYVVVGILGIACGVAQYLSAVGRLDLSAWPWPFVPREDSRVWQYVNAGGMAAIGIAALALGLAR